MRKLLLLSLLLCLTLVIALSACVGSLPAGSTPTAETQPAAEPTSAELTAGQTNTVTMPLVTTGDVATPTEMISDTTPAATGEPSPPVLPASVLAPEIVRDEALDFVRGAYRIELPANATFTPAGVPTQTESVQAVASYASEAWQVIIRTPYEAGGRVVTPVLLTNTGNDSRWWGEIGDDGIITTIVAARMSRPRSQQADGWVGRIVKLPAGSPFDDYFEGEGGSSHGIDGDMAEVLSLLDSLTDYQGRVRVFGELRFAAPDYNGRRLLARRIELLDAPPPETPATGATSPDQPTPTPQTFTPVPVTPAASGLGPIGALFSPLPRSVLSEKVQVAGEAEGLFENKVVIRVETDDGAILGAVALATDAAEMGQKGGFAAETPFQNPPAAAKGRVAIYGENPADGSLTLLAWVNVGLAGPTSGKSVVILDPQSEATIEGSVQVRGTAMGMNTVLVRVEDLAGTVLGQARSRVNAADAQTAGDWQVKFSVRRPRTARPGRIAVYDINPADDSTTLLATTNVQLAR